VLCNVSDVAGNQAQVASDTVTIDTVAPSLSVSHAVDGANGWNVTSPVTETVTAADSGSGLTGTPQCIVDSTSAALAAGSAGTWTFPVSGDGSNAITCNVSDNAGNAAAAANDTANTDIAKPTVSVTGVSNGASYLLNGVPVAGCSTSDATSGVATNAAVSTSGGPVGLITATCSGATDYAGNAGSASAMYTVNYDTGAGFLAPSEQRASCQHRESWQDLSGQVPVEGCERRLRQLARSGQVGQLQE
jgi:large repetitive protein